MIGVARAVANASKGGGAGYRYFRVDVSAGNTAGNTCIGEIDLIVSGVDHPQSAMTSKIAPSPLISSASDFFSPDYDSWKAFENADTNGWLVFSSPAWIQIDLGAGNEVLPDALRIKAGNSTSGGGARAVKDFKLLASNNSSFSGEESELLNIVGETGWGNLEIRTYTI